jgi:O-succinylbenzoic acid--CoA ligase
LAIFIDFENAKHFHNLEVSNSNEYFKRVYHFIQLFSNKNAPLTIKTSGSTGIPKEIHFTMNQAFESAKLSNAFFNLDSNSILLLPMNIDFVGAKMLLVRAFVAKAKIWVVEPSANVFENVPSNVLFDFIALTPYQLLSTLDKTPLFFRQVKKCLIGGSAISNELFRKIENLSTDCKFYESFGMSETLSHFAIKNIGNNEDVFRLIDGYQIDVSSEGQLSIQCPFLDNKIISNDVVELFEDKSFRFLGRKDFVINSGGIKIHPELLENSLQDMFQFPFYFTKEYDNRLGEILILAILESNKLSDAEIMELCKIQITNKYHIPKKIKRLLVFEYTQNGKIKRL